VVTGKAVTREVTWDLQMAVVLPTLTQHLVDVHPDGEEVAHPTLTQTLPQLQRGTPLLEHPILTQALQHQHGMLHQEHQILMLVDRRQLGVQVQERQTRIQMEARHLAGITMRVPVVGVVLRLEGMSLHGVMMDGSRQRGPVGVVMFG